MSLPYLRLTLFLLAVPVMLIVIGGCQSSSTPTATLAPTATSAPTPMLPPIMLDPDASERDFFMAIPREEQDCLAQALGQARVDEVMEGMEMTETDEGAFYECVSSGTFSRLMVGMFIGEVGTDVLSDDSLACVYSALEGVDLMSLITDAEGGVVAFEAFLEMSLCLTDEEAALAGSDGDMGFPVAEMRCLAEEVSLDELAFLFEADMNTMPPVGILAALIECGMETAGGIEEPPFTAEQLTCLEDALGEDALAELFALEGGRSLELMRAVIECGLDVGEGLDELPFTMEQLSCMEDALGGDALAGLFALDGEPSFEVVAAIIECGIEVEDGAKQPPISMEQLTCLEEALGEDALARLFILDGEMSTEVIAAIMECTGDTGDVGMQDSGTDLEDQTNYYVIPDEGSMPIAIFAEQSACLEEALGADALAQVAESLSEGDAGSTTVTAALVECGVFE